MADYKVTDTQLTAIADAIRAKTGSNASLAFPTGFVSAIGGISGGLSLTYESTFNTYLDASEDCSSDVTLSCLNGDEKFIVGLSINGGMNFQSTISGFYYDVITEVGQYMFDNGGVLNVDSGITWNAQNLQMSVSGTSAVFEKSYLILAFS